MTDAVRDLAQGRASYADRAWLRACEALRAADQANELGPEDRERLATSAYVLGREDEYLALLERAHGAHLEADNPRRAARCAFWIGAHFAQRGEMAQAGGWLGRARRLLQHHGSTAQERGYLPLPSVFEHEARGELEAAGGSRAKWWSSASASTTGTCSRSPLTCRATS
jgi:hypothetical protein